LALGDSYTIGESVDQLSRYPELIKSNLSRRNISVNDLKVIAKTGWTTDELQLAMNEQGIQNQRFDIVSLLIGVNNQYRGRTVDSYIIEFEELLKQAIAIANGKKSKVFVISIPDYAFTPFGEAKSDISTGVAAYNQINKEITNKLGVKYFNITDISKEGLNNPKLVANDGLHPSGLQYEFWVESMIDDIVQIIIKDR